MRAAGRSIGARAAVGARDTCNPCNARATIGACDARCAICDMRYAICDMRYAICDTRRRRARHVTRRGAHPTALASSNTPRGWIASTTSVMQLRSHSCATLLS
ncbi:hypothetical protein DF122_10125 [Burkholderia pseudomallei]|nr:hypothetical protein DF122_10125 [Burkholderia pseudomallei]